MTKEGLMHDILIKNGQVVDGTRRAAYPADVAIDGDRITAIEPHMTARARRTIDADGAIVTPGFVDIHTHYDGQVTWDDQLDPPASHGVTTVITGNCGVGFAPVRPGQQRDLIELMEGVEDIPGTALYEGIDWTWESYPDYLDSLKSRRWSMDVGTQIAHGPMRVYVMGQRGVRNEVATPDDIAQMASLTTEAMAAGALGLSMSRIMGHQSIHGEPVPGTFAAQDEVFAIGRAMAASGAVFEVVPGGSVGQGGLALGAEATLASELDWMRRLSVETGLPITFLIVEFGEDPDAYTYVLDYVATANAAGARLYPQTASRPAGVLLSWQSNHLFQRRPTYMSLAGLPFDQRLAQLRRPEIRAAIVSETDAPPVSSSINDAMHLIIAQRLDAVFPLGNPVDYEPRPETSIAAQARRAGVTPDECVYDRLMEDNGHAILMLPGLNYARGNCDAIYTMLSDDNSVVGLADGGAHCGLICDASNTTSLLTHWVRDRNGPRLSLEHVIRKQCAETAALFGLDDRGVLAPGLRADVNVIDFDGLELHPPYPAYDLPAGGMRFLQNATGYLATVAGGQVVRDHDKDTGARPGRLLLRR
jgi:N-acyl-D-amino-acid deacylase